jgi:hypothetical protein
MINDRFIDRQNIDKWWFIYIHTYIVAWIIVMTSQRDLCKLSGLTNGEPRLYAVVRWVHIIPQITGDGRLVILNRLE